MNGIVVCKILLCKNVERFVFEYFSFIKIKCGDCHKIILYGWAISVLGGGGNKSYANWIIIFAKKLSHSLSLKNSKLLKLCFWSVIKFTQEYESKIDQQIIPRNPQD